MCRYPLECVDILPGTQFLGKLEPDQVAEMIKFTTMKPNERLNTLRDGLKHLRLAGDSLTLRHWNFDVEQRPITVPARVLDPPPLTFAECVIYSFLRCRTRESGLRFSLRVCPQRPDWRFGSCDAA